MSAAKPPTIDPVAAARWRARAELTTPWLHEEVSQRMQDRLDYINSKPERWLDWEPLNGSLLAHRSLGQRYPQAQALIWEGGGQRRQQALRALAGPWWSPQRWLGRGSRLHTEGGAPVYMVWANMGLHNDPEPQQTMAKWHAALATDGFLMFSCLGPDTLKELRALYQALGWPAPHHDFIDMHDLGDMLAGAGFAEPVMSMESLTLTFASPERLLQELRGLGRNLHVQRFGGLRTPAWRGRLIDALRQYLAVDEPDGQLALSFEIVYGHAFKPAAKIPVQPHSTVSLQHMRDMLAEPRRGRSMQSGAQDIGQ